MNLTPFTVNRIILIMNNKIRTLAELQAEKTKLKMQIEVSKREFIHSFGSTKTQAKSFLVKKVALPAGVLGLTTLGISKIAGSPSESSNGQVVHKNSNSFMKILPVILPIIRAFLSSTDTKIKLPSFLEKIIAPEQEALIEE